MQKPGRYFLIFLTLGVSVCLIATAAGLYAVDDPLHLYGGWSRGLDLGPTHRVYIEAYSAMRFGYDLHRVSVPISWSSLILLVLAASSLACMIAAGVLARPLLNAATSGDHRTETASNDSPVQPSAPPPHQSVAKYPVIQKV